MQDLSSLGLTEIVRLQNQLEQELRRRFERTLLMAFSDIVGSTPYFARFGDAVGRQLHLLHGDLLGQAAGAAEGRVVDAVGDGVFCAFPSVAAGVRGIVAFQQAMARENAARAREHQLTVRIGLHWGSVLTDGELVTGDAVHVAARVARAAEPGAVCLTRQVFLEFEPALRVLCRPIGTRELKGLAQPVDLLELDWRDPAAFPRRVVIEETGSRSPCRSRTSSASAACTSPTGRAPTTSCCRIPIRRARGRSAAGTSSCAARPRDCGCARSRTG